MGTLANVDVTFSPAYFRHLVLFATYGLLIGLVHRRYEPDERPEPAIEERFHGVGRRGFARHIAITLR